MTLEELKDILDTSELPVAFDHFVTEQTLPYLVYIVADNQNTPADNKVWYTAPQIQLELYTNLKNETTEGTVEAILDSVPFFYTKAEGYLPDEQMYMVTYQFTL